MKANDNSLWILLAKHFAGETSVQEEAEVSTWRSGNEPLYQSIRNDWNFTGTMKKQFNVDRAWNNVFRQIEESSDHEITAIPDSRKVYTNVWLKIAAAVILLLAAGSALYFTISGDLIRVHITTAVNDEVKTLRLPDGSSIYLNSGSEIYYSRKFPKNGREIELLGEAYFEVAANPLNPFLIRVNGALVKAVGTSFNVDQGEAEGDVKVFVESGKVELGRPDAGAGNIIIEPGYLGILEGANLTSVRKTDRNEVAWMTHDMKFEDTRLTEVLEVLSDVYKTELILSGDGLDTLRIFGEFSNDPLDLVLEVITTTNNLVAVKENDRIILSGKK